jgi:hypothetical protein
MSSRGLRLLFGACAVIYLLPNLCIAQTITGSISGNVTDASAAVIPGTEVSLQNELTGETRKTKTFAIGDFLFLALQPGRYTVSIAKTGFKIPGLTLSATQWFEVNAGKSLPGKAVEGGERRIFSTPFPGPAVLYLKRAGDAQ